MNGAAVIPVLLVVCPLSALLAFLAAPRVVGFRVRYVKVLVSTVAGFAAGVAAQAALAIFPENGGLDIIGVILGWCLMGLCHRGLVRGPNGERATFLKAMALVLIQLIGIAVIGVAAVLGIQLMRAR